MEVESPGHQTLGSWFSSTLRGRQNRAADSGQVPTLSATPTNGGPEPTLGSIMRATTTQATARRYLASGRPFLPLGRLETAHFSVPFRGVFLVRLFVVDSLRGIRLRDPSRLEAYNLCQRLG